MTGVSVVLLTRDSARTLSACLDSVRWADEVVALDAGSRDGTRELLATAGAGVHDQPPDRVPGHGGNFDVARNLGYELARGPWLLTVDADEVVTPALRDEILATVAAGERAGYWIPRRNLFWGRPSRVLGEDFQLRLFPKGCGRYEGRGLDAAPVVDCPTRRLAQPLLHYQGDVMRKLDERTSQRASGLEHDGSDLGAAPGSLFWHHFRWYLVHQGAWRDGPRGVALSAIFAAYPALTEVKLRRRRGRGLRRGDL